jgi:hypothetical protein
MHSEHDALRELAVALHQAAKTLFGRRRRDLRVVIKAVLDDWQEREFRSALDGARGVDFDVVFVEARDADLEGLGHGHDVVFAAVVVPEFEDA